jgi:CubicO group peptidase (beta-lactamase class C family)
MNLLLKILKWAGIILLAAILIIAMIFLVNTDLSNPDDVQTFLDNKLSKLGIAGASAVFIENGEITQHYQYGYADLENTISVNEQTVFQIASISKTVTGTAIMQLYENGAFDLDDDINDYLPFPVRHPEFPDTSITFRMLLTHTSGIDNNWDVYDSLYTTDSGGGDSPVSLEEFAHGFFIPGGEYYDATLNFTETAPGEAYLYSNTAYALLGYLVEEISGKPFPVYCKTHIFEPLDMPNTTWLLADTDISKLAIPYDNEAALPHYSFATYPDGTLKTTPEEYSHLMIAMMNNGEYSGNQILQPETVQEMLTPVANENRQALTWDYGVPNELFMGKYNNGNIVGHTGGDPGIFTIAMFNKENKNAVVIFMNEGPALDWKTINFLQFIKRLILEIS